MAIFEIEWSRALNAFFVAVPGMLESGGAGSSAGESKSGRRAHRVSMHRRTSRSAFTLLELVLAISILSMLGAVVTPGVRNHLARARDARRLSDMKAVQEAIDRYYEDNHAYPPIGSAGAGGWDVSSDADFIPALVRGGYLHAHAADPLNTSASCYYYFVYPAGSYGCVSDGSFYVLALTAWETTAFASQHGGYFQCSGRNWNSEFAYVTGGGASFE